jgi:hypothetical protein
LLEGKRVKLVRHKDHRKEYRDVIKNRTTLLEYQEEQGRDVFAGCDYIISFIGLERSRSVFFGVFEVKDPKFNEKNQKYYYKLEPVEDFRSLEGRIVINWGEGARSWVQWYDRKAKEVLEILPPGYIGNFTGLLDFVLEFHELKKLIENPDANHDWQYQLSSVNGIYMILDNSTGKQYIGSACGEKGIWQRWCNYAATGHGGNRELKELMDSDPTYHRNFKFSVLQPLPSNITQREIVETENLYKQKLGSRVHGLNVN